MSGPNQTASQSLRAEALERRVAALEAKVAKLAALVKGKP